MKKIRKNQKRLLLVLLIVVVITIAIFLIVKVVNKKPEEPEIPEIPQVTELPETTYSGMQVKNIVMELKKGNAQDGEDETDITFDIINTTENKVENKYFEVVLFDKNENEIGRMRNYIGTIEVGETFQMSSIYHGDMTATVQIKLIEE